MTRGTSIRNVMTKPVIAVEPNNTVLFATKLMKNNNVECVIVVKSNHKVVGIVTYRDIVDKVVIPGLDPKETLIKDIMSSPVITCKIESTIFDVVNLMVKHQIRRVPVVNRDGMLIGIVTDRDISKFLHKLLRVRPY